MFFKIFLIFFFDWPIIPYAAQRSFELRVNYVQYWSFFVA